MINHIGIGIVYFLINVFEGQKALQNSECVQIPQKNTDKRVLEVQKGTQKATKVLEDPSDISGYEWMNNEWLDELMNVTIK